MQFQIFRIKYSGIWDPKLVEMGFNGKFMSTLSYKFKLTSIWLLRKGRKKKTEQNKNLILFQIL